MFRLLAVVLSMGLMTAGAAAADLPKRPNIVFVITDDQGYGDLSCHGNPILKTPNIDKLHARSVRFVDYNVSPTCSPTRASLMTGRHEFKNGVTHTVNERERLVPSATTLAQILKSAGYTTGIFGKWHLGDEAEYQPGKRGFDEVFIFGGCCIGRSYPGSSGDAPGNKYFDPAIMHNGAFVKTKGYCTDIFFDQAISWMDKTRKEKAPFLCWISTNAPHDPLVVKAEDEAKYDGKVKAEAAKFFGMISNIDDNVGKLMARLKAWGMDEDTIVVFTTDNGTTHGVTVFNAGMRGNKGTPYRGGVRVPFILSWPKHLPQGVDVGKLVAHVDVLPTFSELAGAKIPEKVQLDGRSFVPLLTDAKAKWDDRTLFTQLGRWEKGEAAAAKYHVCAVRSADWRLVNPGKAAAPKWELYDMRTDPGEKNDLSAKMPEVVADLAGRYDRWWADLQPNLVNENLVGPMHNPFHVLYWKQFGGGPEK